MVAIKYAYSTFPDLLVELRLTVAEAHKRLVARGFKFDKKTLYRLASHEPIQTISAPLIGAVCDEFKIGLDDLLVWQPNTAGTQRAAKKKRFSIRESRSGTSISSGPKISNESEARRRQAEPR